MVKFKESYLRLIIFATTIIFVVFGTLMMIRYAKGDRLTRRGSIQGTGLLSANSFPTGAEVYVDGRLTTATDNTLNLEPGTYKIEVKKDGYHNWEKTLDIKAELVTQTNTLLIPISPSLEPLTYTGAEFPVPSADGHLVVYQVSSASASAKNGLYVQELSSSPLGIARSTRQIARTSPSFDYNGSHYAWSPSGSEILVALSDGSHLLLDSDKFNDEAGIKDVTILLPQILRDWEEIIARSERTRLLELPSFFQELATNSGESKIANLYFADTGERLLYQALDEITIPEELIPPLPASSTQPETRQLTPYSWYVYDLKEDRNFLIATGKPTPITKLPLLDNIKDPLPAELGASPSAFRVLQTGYDSKETISLVGAQYTPLYVDGVQWYPDSNHLILTTEKGIEVVEYDGTNRVTVYAGPFDKNFVYAAPGSSNIVTRIQFSPDTSPNLYTIKLK